MSKIKKALYRAKKTRNGQSADIFIGDSRPIRPLDERIGQNGSQLRKVLKVDYRQTKVYNLDADVLRRNKLFALFKNNRMTDHFDIAKGQLLKKLDKLSGNCILVTSAHPGEGKTFSSINLGISIAREHDRTAIVIDTDFRNPWRYHHDFASDFFGLTPDKGLVDYLDEAADLSEIIINPGIDKMTIIPAGRTAMNSAELLASPRMESMIKELKTRYGKQRIVIFDCPASLSCVDPMVFSHLVDGILFVVESERTTTEELKKAMSLYKDKPILGVIINKSQDKDDTWLDG